nr:hypothetical protein [Tanacetum cinerariifolium]
MNPPCISTWAPNSVKNPSALAVAGEATSNGTVSGTMGDEIGEGTIEGAGKIGRTSEEEEEEMEVSYYDSKSEDAKDEGPTTEDEDPAAGDEGLAAGDEGLSMEVENLSLGGYEAVPEGQSSGFVPESERPKRVSALRQPTLTTWIHPEDGIAYIDVPAYPPPSPPAQTLPSLE